MRKCKFFSRWLLAASFLVTSSWAFAQSGKWPLLEGRVGPYSGILSIADAKAAAADGFNLTVQSSYDPQVVSTMRDLGMNIIEIQPWGYINKQCKLQYDKQSGGKHSCTLSAADQQTILQSTAERLEKIKDEKNVAAFWVLDDYPWGNITPTLVAIHDMIQKANQAAGQQRPVICGVGGSLNHRTATNPRLMPDREYIELSLTNITPAACDVVAPYFYGAATENDPSWIDWKMLDLMPWFMQRLHAQGFEHPTLMPVIHAFYADKRGGSTYYVQPRPADMAAQAHGYCAQGGSIAMLFFTWQSGDALHSYSNDAGLRDGVRQGTDACRAQAVRLPTVSHHGS